MGRINFPLGFLVLISRTKQKKILAAFKGGKTGVIEKTQNRGKDQK